MTEGVVVRDAVDADAERWNRFVDCQPESRPLAYYEWRRVLAQAYGLDTCFLLAERSGEVLGVLPTYLSRGLRRRLFSLRFGMNAVDGVVAGALLHRAQLYCRERRASSWLVAGNRFYAGLPLPASIKQTITLALARDEEAMWRNLRDKTRNMIRKATRSGIRVAHGPQFIDPLCELYVATMSRKGLPFHSRSYFRALEHYLRHRLDVIAALLNGRVVGAMCLIGGPIACYPYQAVDVEFRSSGAVQLLNWEAMRCAGAQGTATIDMGESAEGSSVYRSKLNFGGAVQPIYYWGTAAAPPQAAANGAEGPASPRRHPSLGVRVLGRSPAFLRKTLAPIILRAGRVV